MANTGIVLLLILIVILVITVITLLVWAGIETSNQNNNNGGGTVILPSCSSNVNVSSLVQIPNTGANCLQNGATGPLYYIGSISSYDYVVAPWGTQPLDVCVHFCESYSNGKCTGPNYNGQSAQSNFNSCMTQLSGTGCSPPVPIAAKGAILYYAFSPTCNICDNCGKSSQNNNDYDLNKK